MSLYPIHLCLRIKVYYSDGNMGNLSFMQCTGIIFKLKGKHPTLIFLMYPYTIIYMIHEETHEVSHRSDIYFQFIRSTWCLQLICNSIAFQQNQNEPYKFL